MALLSEQLTQVNNKILREDCTSCTSSIATSGTMGVLEDHDELRLGAEANSFERVTSSSASVSLSSTTKTKKNRKDRCCNDNLVIMKQIYCSVENLETDVKYSAISSVMDILNARECDPDEVLTSLGFANCRDEINKRDILSRFKASPLLNNEDNQYLDVMLNNRVEHNNHTRPQYRNSIHKAKEWLALHHNDNSKDKMEYTKSSAYTGTTTNPAGKKSSVNWLTKRKMFPKSRQSSFELLLPNLTEEDNQSSESTTKNRDRSSSLNHPTIRESSLELPLMDENYQMKEQRTNKSIQHSTSPDDLPLIMSLNKDINQPSVQLHPTHENEETHVRNTETNDEDRKLSRLLKSSLLIAHQRDSFELEEINSCNGDPIENSRHRRSGVAFLTIDSCKQNGIEQSHSPNSEGCSDENESSSGFGEDEVLNSTSCNLSSHCRHHISPHTVVESIQKKRGSPTSHSTAVSTHYVYDVELGHRLNGAQNVKDAKRNMNNNAHAASFVDRRFDGIRQRSQSSSALLTNYVPLRRSDSLHGFGKVPNGFILTPVSNATNINSNSDQNENGVGKSRSVFSNARRRRKEFAERSALSGDSITELVSTALVRHGSHFAMKKRRPGHFRFYTSTNDLFSQQYSSKKHDFQRVNSMDSNHRIAFSASGSSMHANLPHKSMQYGDNQRTAIKHMLPPHSTILKNGSEVLRTDSNVYANSASAHQTHLGSSAVLNSAAVQFCESTNCS